MALEVAISDVCSGWEALKPPGRVTVSQAAAETLIISRPGAGRGPYSLAQTPYMVEPANILTSRVHEAMCFVGPAQTGKTAALLDAWLAYALAYDPGDMLMVQMSQIKAKEFSQQRIDRMLRFSPKLRVFKTAKATDDNIHEKAFTHGMRLKIGWPTPSNLASTSYRYVAGTDYDRWDDDIGGEGDGYAQMLARVKTYFSRGMVAVESSPGREILDPKWEAATPHEAPPVTGILGIYNRGDRRMRYWQCPHCRQWILAKPGLSLFNLPPDEELTENIRTVDIDTFASQYARVICPASGCVIRPAAWPDMEANGRWLADGLSIDEQGRIHGTPRSSSIASFWLGGVSAAFNTWETLIRKHMQALQAYVLTGDEGPLKTTGNTDQGVPYMSRHLVASVRSDGTPRDRAVPGLPRYIVPDWGRFLMASVDVQGGQRGHFVVQVHAVGEYLEQQLVDRFVVKWSRRPGNGLDEFAPIDPASYVEDWDQLIPCLLSTYRTNDPSKEMKIKAMLVDSGGEEGVTEKSYEWWRSLRTRGMHENVYLIKGAGEKISGTKSEWYTKETWVGGARQQRGDVRLVLLEPNKFKDMVQNGLNRRTPGPGYYHFPKPKPDGWVEQSFFDELDAERRNENGVWEQIRTRNETFDLCYYIRAGCVILGCDLPGFWASPPLWALPHDRNSLIVSPQERRVEQAALPTTITRRVQRSSYLGR